MYMARIYKSDNVCVCFKGRGRKTDCCSAANVSVSQPSSGEEEMRRREIG